MDNFKGRIDNYFRITEKDSSVRTEITAGVATFMTMCYILIVNSSMIGSVPGVSFEAIFIATAISAIIGTLMMAFYAKLPFAQAPGMGLNAFFVYTVIFSMGLTYGNALVVILISGLLFLMLTLVGVREKIVIALPESLRLGIPAGIGLFIAFIGMQNAGMIVYNPATLVQLVQFNDMFTRLPDIGVAAQAAHNAMGATVAILSFIVIAVLQKRKVKGSILFGILFGTAIYYVLQAIIFGRIGSYIPYDSYAPEGATGLIIAFDPQNPLTAFRTFGQEAFFKFSFAGLFDGGFNSVVTFITLIISFAIVDMFDTIGTLVGTAKKANMLRADGTMNNMKQALLCDSVATVAGSMLGTSTVTTYVESSAGIAEGGKTGFTSVIVAVLFLLAMFLTPLASMIPAPATAAALIYIGVLMISSLADIDFNDPAVIAPAFITSVGMLVTFSISDGIGLGIITYLLIKLFTGKAKDINPLTFVIGALFILKFFVIA